MRAILRDVLVPLLPVIALLLLFCVGCEPKGPQYQTTNLTKKNATVARVVDGDTIDVTFQDGSTERVRLLLIDTPESKHPEKGEQPYGKDAYMYTKELLENQDVVIEVGNPERDKYDRLLGYVWYDNTNINQRLIEEGYARVAYVTPPNTKYLDEFKQAETQVKNERKRIWETPGYVTENGYDPSVIH